jgi:YD repeat-containing protein
VQRDPHSGRITRLVEAGRTLTKINYDAAGRVRSIAGADGSVCGYGYDGAGRLTAVRAR